MWWLFLPSPGDGADEQRGEGPCLTGPPGGREPSPALPRALISTVSSSGGWWRSNSLSSIKQYLFSTADHLLISRRSPSSLLLKAAHIAFKNPSFHGFRCNTVAQCVKSVHILMALATYNKYISVTNILGVGFIQPLPHNWTFRLFLIFC